MTADAIARVRETAPHARIDLVVGTWNAALARTIDGLDAIETLDVPWMARQGAGSSWPAALGSGRSARAPEDARREAGRADERR